MLKHEVDVITPLVTSRASQAKAFPCPRCGGSMRQRLYEKNQFSSDDPLPRMMLACVDCEHSVDQQTGVVVKLGNPAAIDDPFKLDVGQ